MRSVTEWGVDIEMRWPPRKGEGWAEGLAVAGKIG